MNNAHHHHQVHWEEQLMKAACHALVGHSSSRPCPGLSQGLQPGFPKMLQLCLQLGWVLSGTTPCDLPGFVPSTMIPITPFISWLQVRIEKLRAVGYIAQGHTACVCVKKNACQQDLSTYIYYNIAPKGASVRLLQWFSLHASMQLLGLGTHVLMMIQLEPRDIK